MNLKSKRGIFDKEYLFKENTINIYILPNDWWKYIRLNDSRQKDIIEGLMGAKSSSGKDFFNVWNDSIKIKK